MNVFFIVCIYYLPIVVLTESFYAKICINADGLPPNGANKNASLLPATTPR